MTKYLVTISALLVVAPLAQASPSASCTARCATRTGTTCTAPAYVHVDCIGDGTSETRDSDSGVRPFHDLHYKIDYGDSACVSGQGTWANSDLRASKNVDYSPIGAHVYECPGTFTISTTVTDSAGVVSTTADTVVVESEDAGWTAANTRCVANGTTPVAGSGGCPAGVTSLVNSSDFDAALQLGAGKRTLYRCGDTFTIDTNPNLSDASVSGSLIGGYGSCAGNPVRVTYGGGSSILTDPDLDGWRLRDLRFTATGAGEGTQIIGTGANVSKMLLLRVETLNVGMCTFNGLEWNQTAWNDLNAYVSYRCDLTVHNESGGWPVLYGVAARYGAIIDAFWNVGGSGVLLANGMRTMGLNRFLLAHSKYRATNGAKLTMQFRSAGDPTGRDDRFNVLSDLRLHDNGGEGFRTIALCYTHGCANETDGDVQKGDYIIEDVRTTYGPNKTAGVQLPFQIEASNVTIRNNIVDARLLSPGTYVTYMNLSDQTQLTPTNIDFYNNTYIRGGNTQATTTICGVGGIGSGHRCRNNLIYDVTSGDNSLTSGSTFASGGASNNVHLNANEEGCPFAGNDGSCRLTATSETMNFDEFKIRASGGSRALVYNAGFDFPESTSGRKAYVYKDSSLACRGARTGGPDNEWDIGASEFGAPICAGSSGSVPAALAPPTLLAPR